MNENVSKIIEVIEQLEDLIADRKSFLSGDEADDAIFKADIEALEFAIEYLKK